MEMAALAACFRSARFGRGRMMAEPARRWGHTVFALATGAPPTAISVVRISGAAAHPTLQSMLRNQPFPATGKVRHSAPGGSRAVAPSPIARRRHSEPCFRPQIRRRAAPRNRTPDRWIRQWWSHGRRPARQYPMHNRSPLASWHALSCWPLAVVTKRRVVSTT